MNLTFAPKIQQRPDRIGTVFELLAYALLVIAAGTLPVSVLFPAFIGIGFSKTMIMLVSSLLALVCICLSVLRTGSLRIGISVPIVALWGIAAIAFISALVSGDMSDAIRGDVIETQTAGFIAILALVATMATFFARTEVMTLRFFQLFMLSIMALGIFQLLRVFFGPEFLSFGVFSSLIATPLGSWNDLGILFGLFIILSLIAIDQIPLSRSVQLFLVGGVVLSLLLLAIVNFVYVWFVIGIISLIFLIYGLVRDRMQFGSAEGESSNTSLLSIGLNGFVFVIAALFILAGPLIGGWITEKTGVSYVEVRPSFTATVDIGKYVYETNAFTGIGPNRFSDAWRLYKDGVINNTIFWNTNFVAGNGYIVTWFVTTGLFGLIAWFVFIISYLILGYKLLVGATTNNRFWYFVGGASFVMSAFIWGMSFLYVPGAALLLIAAFATGLTVASAAKLLPPKLSTDFRLTDRRTGFILIAATLIVMIGSIAVLYEAGRQYASVYTFNKTLNQPSITLDSVRAGIQSAYTLYPNDTYIRQLGRFETEYAAQLSQVAQPTDEQRVAYQTSVTNGVAALRQAATIDPTQPLNWGFLGQLWFVVSGVSADVRDAAIEQATEAVNVAKQYDPKNPEYRLLEAQIAVQAGDLLAAREAAVEAVRLKPDYTASLNFLAQLDISEGNTEAAIETVRAMIQLEPNNSARYYQLGILYSSLGETDRVVEAMEAAVARDQAYANARYILALGYIDQGRRADAVAQLEIVRDLNPDNAGVQALIDQINTSDAGEIEAVSTTSQVNETNPVTTTNEGVTTTDVAPQTDLVVPVNAVSPAEEADIPAVSDEATETEAPE